MTAVQQREAMKNALVLREAKRFAEAERICLEVLARDPQHAGALHLQGVICNETGRTIQALDLLARSVAMEPNDAVFQSNLAAVLGTAGRLAECVDVLRRAIQLKPDLPLAHNNLGVTLERMQQYAEAAAAYRIAAELARDQPMFFANLGNALRLSGKLAEAETAFRNAIAIRENYVPAWQGLAALFEKQSRHAEAVNAFREAITLAPADAALHSSFLYAIHYSPDFTPEQIFAEHLRWAERYEAPLHQSTQPHDNDRSPDRRLRIGYVSPDFRRHSVATFFEPLLANHDHQSFEVICYSATEKPDERTGRLQTMADRWRDISQVSDREAAEIIRNDQIDLLIDLTGHMGRNRLTLFARKPAPVQVTYVGHPDSTGMRSMDYRMTDPHADPPVGDSDRFHTERLIRLPTTFGCYQAPEENLPVTPLPALTAGHVTLGCLNNPAKITEPAVQLWCRILQAVPASRLVLLTEGDAKHLDVLFATNGIDPDGGRVEFVKRLDRRGYFKAFNRIDLALDTFPYCGQTTTCDGLWMGVPPVTLAGQTYVSRMGVSLLTNVGLPELIARTPQEYVDIAVALAASPNQLQQLRSDLRQRLLRSPVMDGASLARDVEGAYRQMWQEWCGEADDVLVASADVKNVFKH